MSPSRYLQPFPRYWALIIWGHDLDLSGSRDVIGHVTIGLTMVHILLVVYWIQVSISNGFQGRGIEWRYFRLHQIQVGSRPPSLIISNGHISATAHSIHLYSAHRVVIFAIAQLSLVLIGLTLDRTVLAWKWIEVIQAIWALMRSLQNSSFTGRSKHVSPGGAARPH